MEHLVSSNLSFLLSYFLSSFISFLHSFSYSFFLSSHLPCIPGLLYFYCIYTIFISHLSRSYLTSLSTSTFTVHISFSPPHTMPCRTMPCYAVLGRIMPCLPLCLAPHPSRYYFRYSCRIFNQEKILAQHIECDLPLNCS